ncbi:MAG TPA: hypothetical protein VGG19_03485 [Tepidisphaeraceae bacterium]
MLMACLVGGCATIGNNSKGTSQVSPPPMPRHTNDVILISAVYGSGVKFADVTARVDLLLHRPNSAFYAHPEWLGTDPTPGWNKVLVIVYELQGRRRLFTAGEGGKVSQELLIHPMKKERRENR